MALSFAPPNSHIVVPFTSAMNVSYLTVTGWVYRLGSNQQTVMSRRRGTSQTAWVLAFDGDRLVAGILTSTGWSSFSPKTDFPSSTWIFLAMTWDGTTLLGYVNAVEKGRANRSGNLIADSNKITIGAAETATSLTDYCKSYLSDVRVYARALSQIEIGDLYVLRGRDINVDSLVCRYDFSDGRATDLGPYRMNGDLVNNPVYIPEGIIAAGRSPMRG